jgi:hypothetical protein
MFNWAKQQLAHVAGTQEPIYGPEAILPVTKQAESTPYTELTKTDLKWDTPSSSCVETQTFYVFSDEGHVAFVQVIYSNVAIQTTCQFNTQIYYPDRTKPKLWSSDPLDDVKFDKEKLNFSAAKCSIELAEDGNSYTIKSSTNLQSIVTLKFTRSAPGFVVGKDGNTLYGTDLSKPWGSMKHRFWPRCKVEGSVLTKDGEVNLNGKGIFIHALQGMKPHHCASRWNFNTFQGPTYSAVMMEFTTPPSYGETVVNVGAVVDDNKIIFGGAPHTVEHTAIKEDPDVRWPEPTSAKYVWKGKDSEGKDISAEISDSLGQRLDRVDVMGELPAFVKSLASTASGTRPYIYQFAPTTTLKISHPDGEKTEEGPTFIEATFIS